MSIHVMARNGVPDLCLGDRFVQATDTIMEATGPVVAVRNGH